MTELVITGATSIAAVYGFVYMSLFQPLQSNQYQDHGSLQSLTASVSDIQEQIRDQVEPTLNAIANRQGIRSDSIVHTASSTD